MDRIRTLSKSSLAYCKTQPATAATGTLCPRYKGPALQALNHVLPIRLVANRALRSNLYPDHAAGRRIKITFGWYLGGFESHEESRGLSANSHLLEGGVASPSVFNRPL